MSCVHCLLALENRLRKSPVRVKKKKDNWKGFCVALVLDTWQCRLLFVKCMSIRGCCFKNSSPWFVFWPGELKMATWATVRVVAVIVFPSLLSAKTGACFRTPGSWQGGQVTPGPSVPCPPAEGHGLTMFNVRAPPVPFLGPDLTS